MPGSISDNPIVCGRRNCATCKRWRHAVDFQWVWKRDGHSYKPHVKSTCNACKRAKEKARYHDLTPAQKRAKGIRANEQARERRIRDRAQIVKLEGRVETLEERVKTWKRRVGVVKSQINGEPLFDILPIRMFLLRQIRLRGSIQAVADATGYDPSRLRRLADGYYWESDCRPVPLRTVSLGVVDTLLTRLDGEGLLDDLYPEAGWEED